MYIITKTGIKKKIIVISRSSSVNNAGIAWYLLPLRCTFIDITTSLLIFLYVLHLTVYFENHEFTVYNDDCSAQVEKIIL